MSQAKQPFVLKGEYIELYKLLKFESIASSGGEAKVMIAGGAVMVNGEQELGKRKKLVIGDVVTAMNQTILIVSDTERA